MLCLYVVMMIVEGVIAIIESIYCIAERSRVIKLIFPINKFIIIISFKFLTENNHDKVYITNIQKTSYNTNKYYEINSQWRYYEDDHDHDHDHGCDYYVLHSVIPAFHKFVLFLHSAPSLKQGSSHDSCH